MDKSYKLTGAIRKAVLWFIRSRSFFAEQARIADDIAKEQRMNNLINAIDSSFNSAVNSEWKKDVWAYVMDNKKTYNPLDRDRIEKEINYWFISLAKELGWI